MKDYEYIKILSYDPFNSRAGYAGMVQEWRVDKNGVTVGIAETKHEAIQIARQDNKREKARTSKRGII